MNRRSDRPLELGAFLKARHADLDPATVVLADTRARAMCGGCAAMRSGASPDALGALAGALRLPEDERSYLFQLADKDGGRPQPKPRAERVAPQLQQLLDNLRDSRAIMLGRYLDILAWNPPAAAVFRDFAEVPRRHRNFRMLFLDPRSEAGTPTGRPSPGYASDSSAAPPTAPANPGSPPS
ncbi:hypothetical protein [Streptomyces sp. NPDC008092]|uniref:MmyB family transcriptional regulator n=1 Tax=Streptomyces sp. NPDC008092 TaxID=3364808 RepID=UPI0036E7B416